MTQQDAALDTLIPTSGGTLGDVVEESEATLFVGRKAQLATLLATVNAARTRSAAAYLHGPAGVGKSALLKVLARSLRDRNVPVVLLDHIDGDRTADHVDRAIADALGITSDGYGLSAAIAATVNERALPNGLVLIVDHYDDLMQADYWLRGQIFRQLGPGVCLILAGRQPAAQLWSHDLGWTRALVEMPLRDLDESEVSEFMSRCGLSDASLCSETYGITGGRPQLLGLAANALLLQPDATANTASRHSGSRLALFLIEHILHPGSRRRSWRAGTGSSEIDTTVAAAAVLPSFEPSELAAVASRAGVQGSWPALLSLTTLTEDALRYRFPEPLRRRLAEAVVHQRPWAERHWRRLAIRYEVRAAAEGRGDDRAQWDHLAHLAREAPWWEWFNPPSLREGALQIVRGAAAARLVEASGIMPRADQAEPVTDVLHELGDGLIVAQGRDGSPQAVMAAVPASRDTWPFLTKLAQVSPQGPDLPDGALNLWAGATLVLYPIVSANPEAAGALLGETCREWGQYDRIVAIGCAGWGQANAASLLDALGLQRASADAQGDLRILDLARIGYATWLAGVMQPRVQSGVSRGQWATAAQKALQVLDEPDLLLRTSVGQYYSALTGVRRGGAVRTWILDALVSADLGDAPPSGRVLLTLYYVDRIGPHEVIAERMNLPRTTYFRCHRQALTKLGESLFK